MEELNLLVGDKVENLNNRITFKFYEEYIKYENRETFSESEIKYNEIKKIVEKRKYFIIY